MTKNIIGIDIAKLKFDGAYKTVQGRCKTRTFQNDDNGFQAFLASRITPKRFTASWKPRDAMVRTWLASSTRQAMTLVSSIPLKSNTMAEAF